MEETEKAYFAGLIDGEGCIACYPHGEIPSLKVSVGMVHAETIHRLKEAFGGTLWVEPSKGNHRAVYRWQVSGTSCGGILEAIKPHVFLKRQHVLIALAFIRTITPGNNQPLTIKELLVRQELSRQLKELNKVGVQ